MSFQQIAYIDEILDRIFIHLDTSTLVTKIQLVCKQWSKVADEHVDYTYCDNWPIRWATFHGHLTTVNKLLQNPKVDPSAFDNYAIMQAAINGHLEMVNRLLEDPRVDPSVFNNYAIYEAHRNGYSEVVNRLLQDERVRSTWSLPQ
jgi:hypothetical protein